MLRTSLRNLVAYKVRLALTALAVVFGVAFVSAVLVFGDTLKQAMTDAALREHRGISVDVRGTKHAVDHLQIPPLDESLAARLRALPGTASVTGHVTGFTAVVDRAGALVRKKTSAIGANAVPGPDGKDPRYPLITGRLPVKAGEAALDERTAEAAGYKVGDRIRIVARGPVLDQTVVGVFTTDSAAVEAGGTLTLLDTATAQELYLEPGVYGELRLNARPGTSQEQLRAAAAPLLPGGAEALTGDKLRQDDRNRVNKEIASLRTLLLVFAGIALFVGSFIIANTFAMLVAQRTRELALLRAIGATRRQVTRSVMFEALAVGVVAGLGGFVIGIGLAIGLRDVLNGVGANLTPGPTVVAGTTALWSLLVGIGVTLVAAWLPVRRAAKIPPVAALRTNLPPSTSSLRRRNIAGALTLVLGGAVLLAGIKGSATGNAKVFTVMGGAGIVLIGVIVLTPLLAAPAVRVFGALLRRIHPVEGRLAYQNAARNPRRTAATASALMIGMVLVTSLTIFGTSLKHLVDRTLSKGITAEFVLSSSADGQSLAPEIAAAVAKVPGVTAVSPVREARATVDGKEHGITAVDPASAFSVLATTFTQGGPQSLSSGLLVSKQTADERKWRVGTSVSVTFPDGERARLAIGGIYDEAPLLGALTVSLQTLTPHVDVAGDDFVLAKVAPRSKDGMRDALRKAVGNSPAVNVQTAKEVRKDFNKLFDVMLDIVYGLLSMAIVIAVLGVVNTLAMSVFERTREIGMMRAIGLDRRRTRRVIRLESLIISVFGGLLGVVLGLIAGVGGVKGMARSTKDLTVVVPWDRVLIFLVLAAIVGVLAAAWPARRAARLDVLTALRTD
ncbi:ABC transporter permease [Embleya sp. NPDC127516]|uniref:ABC transporter permease n=1 Tax=Embleya sp. NPDC127516 TaxID=3363990 RepID=UPI003806AA4A